MDGLSATISTPASLPLRVDEFSDLVGGLKWNDFIKSVKTKVSPDKLPRIYNLAQFFNHPFNFISAKSNPERKIIEIVYLKVTMLYAICSALHSFHKLTHKPMGNVHPDLIGVSIASSNIIVPKLWNYSITINDNNDLKNLSADNLWMYKLSGPHKDNFSIVDDLHNLGVVFIRLLLVNRIQDLGSIYRKFKSYSPELNSYKNNPSQNALLAKILSTKEFQVRNITYEPSTDVENIVQNKIWQNLISIIVKLLTEIDGFSYSRLVPIDRIWIALSYVMRELELCKELLFQTMLFEPIDLDIKLESILESLYQELATKNRGLTPDKS